MKRLMTGLTVGLLMFGMVDVAQAASVAIIDNPNLIGKRQQTPEYSATQGAYQAYDTTQNIAYNKVVTVSGTIQGYPTIHKSSFINMALNNFQHHDYIYIKIN